MSDRRIAVIILSLATTACATMPPQPPAGASPQATNGTTWVDRSAEYQAIVLQTYRHATAHVEASAGARRAGRWAVVLDADETVLNNVVYQLERERAGLAYTAASWNAWVKRREATPVPGALAFLSRVKSLGGVVAIVTNRLESECEDTRAVFRAHQLAFDVMLCRPDGSPSDKNPRFIAVAAGQFPGAGGPLDVVAALGDNILDFPSLSQATRQQGDAAFADFGVRFFVLPNPMYGSWQR